MDKPILPDLFKTIQEIHPRLQGWAEMDKALTLASLVVATRPEVVLEIGCFGGKSAFPLALACKAINRGTCLIVDPWSNEVAVREQVSEVDRAWWAAVDLESLYHNFVKLISDHNLEGHTKIIRKESKNVEPPVAIGLGHFDGSHSTTGYNDIVRFAPRIIVGGTAVVDDIDWSGGAIGRGEKWLLQNGFKRLYPLQSGAVFQRVR